MPYRPNIFGKEGLAGVVTRFVLVPSLPYTILHILLLGADQKVIGIHTERIEADVAYDQMRRRGFLPKRISNPMSGSVIVCDPKYAIPFAHVPLPVPTAVGLLYFG